MGEPETIYRTNSGIKLSNIDIGLKDRHAFIQLTPTDPKIYGYVKNVYFGPNMASKTTFSLKQPGIHHKLNMSIMYTYSNRNRNSVKGERRHFFTPNNYTNKKYAVRANELQFYSSIPIYRMTIRNAIDVANELRGVIFCNKTPVNADPKSIQDNYDPDAQKKRLPDLAAFEMVWIDKLPDVNNSHYGENKTKTITYKMFKQYDSNPFNDLSQLNFTYVNDTRKDNYDRRIELLYEHEDPKLSKNLFMNLLRLSIKEGRVSGIISYLSGGKTRRRSRLHRRKTRKN